jgi:hypothetical protein
MEAASADLAKKILSRDFANLAKRVQSGGKLTRNERAMLQSMAGGAEAPGVTVAKNYVELAGALGVSRQAVHAWKKLGDAPQPASNGLHDVAAWREFMRRRGLKGGAAAAEGDPVSSLKARRLLVDVEERELRLAAKRGEYVSLSKVEAEWNGLVGQATALLRSKFEQELPPVLAGLDAHGIQIECRRAIDEVCRTLHGGE